MTQFTASSAANWCLHALNALKMNCPSPNLVTKMNLIMLTGIKNNGSPIQLTNLQVKVTSQINSNWAQNGENFWSSCSFNQLSTFGRF